MVTEVAIHEYLLRAGHNYIAAGSKRSYRWIDDAKDPVLQAVISRDYVRLAGMSGGPYQLTDKGVDWIEKHREEISQRAWEDITETILEQERSAQTPWEQVTLSLPTAESRLNETLEMVTRYKDTNPQLKVICVKNVPSEMVSDFKQRCSPFGEVTQREGSDYLVTLRNR